MYTGGSCFKYSVCENHGTYQGHGYVCDDGQDAPNNGCCQRFDTHVGTDGNLACPRHCDTSNIYYLYATSAYECLCDGC